ncbi:MAG: HAMP domain-containing sensor histidine kinase [Acidobacteriota bacterium]
MTSNDSPKAAAPTPSRLRRLYLEQAAGWSIAWLVGLGSLFAVAVGTHGELSQQNLDAELGLTAVATYGLTWLDGDVFHDEALRLEPAFQQLPFDLWVVAPGPSGRVFMAPESPQFSLPDLGGLAAKVMAAEDEAYFEDGLDANGAAYRLHSLTFYDETNAPRAAIVVVGDPSDWREAHGHFVRTTAAALVILILIGLGVGMGLSERSLRPVLASLEQQRQFLTAAAHELRTPVASLRAVCDSAKYGDESPSEALERVGGLVGKAGDLVEELLLLAQLDAGAEAPVLEKVRLDLLVEATLPEDGSVDFSGEESIVIGEPALLETAFRNLVENARRHGDGAPCRVRVAGGTVTIEDDGPGFDESLLARVKEPFVSRPGSPGNGLGLAIVDMIAIRHGGRLHLENRGGEPQDGAGARVTLSLPPLEAGG